MHFAEEHCFGCASALHDTADQYGYPTDLKTFTTWLKRYKYRLDRKDVTELHMAICSIKYLTCWVIKTASPCCFYNISNPSALTISEKLSQYWSLFHYELYQVLFLPADSLFKNGWFWAEGAFLYLRIGRHRHGRVTYQFTRRSRI